MTGLRYADPLASHAVLVGVSAYPNMGDEAQLPAVTGNLTGLSAALCDPEIWGLPLERCTVVAEPQDSETVIQALRSAAAEATDTLLFYYAGHGMIDALQPDELYLGLSGSYEPFGTHAALRYGNVRSEFIRALRPRNRIVMIDSCWSGLATLGRMGDEPMAAMTAIVKTGVLTASARDKAALSPKGESHTAFTGTLLNILEDGIADGPDVFDLGYLYRALDQRLQRAGPGRTSTPRTAARKWPSSATAEPVKKLPVRPRSVLPVSRGLRHRASGQIRS